MNMTMEEIRPARLRAHLDLLEEKVFQTKTKWPHFQLLLDDVQALAQKQKEESTVVSLERALLYGGNSLFAPLFQAQNFISVECGPQSAENRGAYNKTMVEDDRFIAIPTTRRGHELVTGLEENIADLVIVPNLVHHIADQSALFLEMARITKPGGVVYVFEPLVRELHQIPDDYIRYTPYGMAKTMRDVGLAPQEPKMEGGPFSVIGYCWIQALQYFTPEKRQDMEQWFYQKHYPELLQWDKEFPMNLEREHTKFPMSFSIQAQKI